MNIAWPRRSLAPLDASWYQVWAALLVLGVITAVGLAYLVAVRPYRRLSAGCARRASRASSL